MDQLKNFADDRLITGCIYCGQPEETREHVPSRVFLDAPLPENLPVVGACWACNNDFSLNEEYLACLLEAVISGSANPEEVGRLKISKILTRTPALRARLDGAKRQEHGQTYFATEPERVESIIIKLARGHAAYELSQPCRGEPSSIWWCPLEKMDEVKRVEFEACQIAETFGEIGSRGMQRWVVAQLSLKSESGENSSTGLFVNDWIEVQDRRYRYHAIEEDEAVKIKIVFSEYLACEVAWDS